MTPFRRRLMLYGVLLTCLALGARAVQEDQAVVSVRERKADSPQRASVARQNNVTPLPDLGNFSRVFIAGKNIDPFGVRSWAPVVATPPLPATTEVPVAPIAPPLPFTYAGKLEIESGKWVIYLAKGEQSFSVSAGDVFDGVYRFDGIDSGNLVIVYLPLATKQTLPIAADF